MNYQQALRLRNHGEPYVAREDQINFLQEVYGPTAQFNERPLGICSDQQLYAIVKRLYEREAPKVIEEEKWRRIKRVKNDHARHLYEIFNIPSDQQEEVSPSELEAELLK